MKSFLKHGVDHLKRSPISFFLFKYLGFFTIRFLFPLQYFILISLMDCDSVLDLGCGPHSMIPILPRAIKTTGVESFDPYYQEALKKGRHHHYIHSDILKVSFEPKSFDAVVMLDVLEHLKPDDGAALLTRMETWARKKIIIFTPNGFLHQACYDDNALMEHKSGWTEKDMQTRGFRVFGVRGIKNLMPKEGFDHDKKEGILDFFLNLTQIITYHFPSIAFQLFCVKEKNSDEK